MMALSSSPSSELSLECKPPTQSHVMLVMKSIADHKNDRPDQTTTQKIQEYLHLLEEERLKIDAFKRELPLCMQLLINEMETSRQKLQSHNVENQETRPVLEEFMPLKNSNTEGSDQKPTNISDKANWMISAQLWSQSGDGNKQQHSTTFPTTGTEFGFISVNPKLAFDTKQRNEGAFLPFTNDQNLSFSNSRTRELSVSDLALASSELEMEERRRGTEIGNGMDESRTENPNKGGNGVSEKAADATTTTTNRKARRCWSPDLHRRFVNALQMLGGSQVATPKQIRELMKVDGLTNDEVKSHLQKYRLHTRRPGSSPPTPGAPPPQLVVLGGIWVPPEYTTGATTIHGGTPAIYSTTSHPISQISPHYCSPQDFYPPLPLLPPSQTQTQLHHHQVHVYKTTSHTQNHSSPELESIEDGKSENSNWKSSGENDVDGKKSNGCEITLKF